MQVQYLFRHARATGREELLLEQFRQGTLAVAVGKVTAQALKEHGVDRIVMPELERMGAMIIELARYYEKGGNA
ncbi:uroporphyrinogen-III synthase [compost metagenome]